MLRGELENSEGPYYCKPLGGLDREKKTSRKSVLPPITANSLSIYEGCGVWYPMKVNIPDRTLILGVKKNKNLVMMPVKLT